MLKEIGNAIIAKLKTYEVDDVAIFKMVEFYEGQLDPESVGEWSVVPPAAFVEITGGGINETINPFEVLRGTIHLTTTKLLRNPGNVLDIIEWIVLNMHGQGLRNSPDTGVSLGRVFVTGFDPGSVIPGQTHMELKFEVK